MVKKRVDLFAALRSWWGRRSPAGTYPATKPKPLVIVGTVAGIERSIIPDHVVFRGMGADGWRILDGRESPLTINGHVFDGSGMPFRGKGQEYHALVDLKRHPVQDGDVVLATLESARLHSIGMTVLLVAELRPFRYPVS